VWAAWPVCMRLSSSPKATSKPRGGRSRCSCAVAPPAVGAWPWGQAGDANADSGRDSVVAAVFACERRPGGPGRTPHGRDPQGRDRPGRPSSSRRGSQCTRGPSRSCPRSRGDRRRRPRPLPGGTCPPSGGGGPPQGPLPRPSRARIRDRPRKRTLYTYRAATSSRKDCRRCREVTSGGRGRGTAQAGLARPALHPQPSQHDQMAGVGTRVVGPTPVGVRGRQGLGLKSTTGALFDC